MKGLDKKVIKTAKQMLVNRKIHLEVVKKKNPEKYRMALIKGTIELMKDTEEIIDEKGNMITGDTIEMWENEEIEELFYELIEGYEEMLNENKKWKYN